VPIHVISGESDEVYPLSWVRACLARFPGFAFHHESVPGLSHMEGSTEEECIAIAHLLRLQGHPAGIMMEPGHVAKTAGAGGGPRQVSGLLT